jgi:hypothetical protein
MFLSLANGIAGQPPDIWHDPNAIGLMNLGVAVSAILVAIAVGIYQVRQGRIRRKLVYQRLSNAPLVSVNSAVADQVEIDIRVKGTLVKNAQPVKYPSDYEYQKRRKSIYSRIRLL